MSNRHAPSPRHRPAAVLLPYLGLFLLMPPVIRLVAVPIDVWGIPLIVVYLFGVWLALILSAVWLSRRLVHRSPPDGARAMAGIDVPEQQPPQGPR